MNKVDPEPRRNQTHDSRKRTRRQPGRPKSRPNPKPKSKSTAKKPKGASSLRSAGNNWFSIRDIIDEKIERGRILYLIDWDGTDRDGRPYDPTWEPAANVTTPAINAWRDKKTEEVSRAVGAPESTQETDPVQVPNWRRERSTAERGYSNGTVARSPGNTKAQAHKRRRTIRSLTPRLGRPQTALGDCLPPPSSYSDPGNSGVNETTKTAPVATLQGARIVVELPGASAFNPSEFRVIPPSEASQPSSQATLPERMRPRGIEVRDQRVIPDSQEISGTSVSEAHNSYREPSDLYQSQFSHHEELPAPEGPLRNSLRASPSPSIPSHQLDPRFIGVSGYFANPNISTNLGISTGTNQNRSLLHPTSTGPFQGPANESSPVFQSQPELDFDIVAATSSATSHNATVQASLQQQSDAHASQDIQSQRSHIIDEGSTQSNSQAAQIVQPLGSEPGEATSQSQSDFFIFEVDRTVAEPAPCEHTVQPVPQAQTSFRAPSKANSLPRIFTAFERYEPAPSIALRSEPQSPIRVDNSVSRCATVPPITPTNMDGTSATGTPLSAKERLRLLREAHFTRSSVIASSPAPLENIAHASHSPTPQVEASTDGETPSMAGARAPLISPMLSLPPDVIHTQTGTVLESPQTSRGPSLLQDHMLADHLSLDSYNTPPIEQPATLDPSALTLSIENDVEGSPSVPTDDGSVSGRPPGSTASRDDDIQADNPRSLLPHVPTGPSEYLITLPFQTSSRPQYNDIIRENEALMKEYNSSFQVFPHETPPNHVVEKLDAMFSRLFDICDFPPFLDSLASMSSGHITKHVIGTNAKFSFVAELLDNLLALASDKKVLILVRPGKLMDLLGHVIQSRACRYIRSGQQVVSPTDAKHPLTVALSSTSDDKPSISSNVDVVIAFDHTFRQELVNSTDQSTTPIILALVNTASIQHLNMRIMENLQPLERKNVLMLALVKAMRYIEEPDHSESLFSTAEKFARRIQLPEDDDDVDDDFYWEPQSIPNEIFDDLYAASSQIEATQLGSQGLGINQQPGSRKRSHVDDDAEEVLLKRPKVSQPKVVTSSSYISDAMRKLFGDDLAQGSEPDTVILSTDKLQAVLSKMTELESKLEESKARENEFRELSNRAQNEAQGLIASINGIQTKYMEALKDRGVFEADCKTAQEQASVLSGSLDSCLAEIATLKATRTELEKKLSEAHDVLLRSSNPDLVKMAELEQSLNTANAEVRRLEKRLVVTESDAAYRKNLYDQATQRAIELSSENRGQKMKIQELQRVANENIIEVHKMQNNDEIRILQQQVMEQKNMALERVEQLKRIQEELKSMRGGRRRRSSIPRSPRLSSRNGNRGSSGRSRGTSPQPPVAVFDGPAPAGSGNVQNAALFNQGPGTEGCLW